MRVSVDQLWCYWLCVWGNEAEASWHHWHIHQLNNSCNISSSGLAQGSVALSPSSGQCDNLNSSHTQKHMEFSTLGKLSLYFFFVGPQELLLSAVVFWLNIKSADNTTTTRVKLRKSLSWWQTNCFCGMQWNNKCSVISRPNMRCNCSVQLKITGRSGKSKIFWSSQKYNKTTCTENCPRKRTKVACWTQVWLTVNYVVRAKKANVASRWYPFQNESALMRKLFCLVNKEVQSKLRISSRLSCVGLTAGGMSFKQVAE